MIAKPLIERNISNGGKEILVLTAQGRLKHVYMLLERKLICLTSMLKGFEKSLEIAITLMI